jgi:hypothetical protein
MASGRFLSVSVAEDDKLSKLSMTAEYVYLKTIPHLDRDGLITGKPGLLYSKVCPTREELFGGLQVIIDEWVQVGLVIRYVTDEGPALFFRGFSKNNNLPHYERERPSRFPAPPGYYRASAGLLPNGTEPPTKKPKRPRRDPIPPSSSDSHVEVQECILDEVQDEVPIFGTEEEDQDQEEAASARARTYENTAAAALRDPPKRVVSDFVKAYERIWGLTISSPYIGEQVQEWESRVTYEGWCYALQQCTDRRNQGHWSYLRPILERIEREGYQSQRQTMPAPTKVEFALEDVSR